MITVTPEHYGDLVEVATRPDYKEWLAMVRATGGCAAPIHLWGESTTLHSSTGEILHRREPGKLLVACGNRRKTRCPSCSETYRADTFQLIRAGLRGGKGVPESVASHPKVFATFTAPSFGSVHHRVTGADGQIEPCQPRGAKPCQLRHDAGDPLLGQPLDPKTYDYVGAVLWNALSTKLWASTVQLVNRATARLLGVPQRRWPEVGRVSVSKVAEFQARGVVHFHAIFRLDGPEPDEAPRDGATTDLLCEAIARAAQAALVDPPEATAIGDLSPIVWGEQLDLRPIGASASDDSTLTDAQVAGYVAKYATKGAEASGTVDRPIACRRCRGTGRNQEGPGFCETCAGEGARTPLRSHELNAHANAMITTCWHLGGLPELEELRLRPWAHMLGFRGHFSTKSRRYSTTLGCLRSARRDWRDARTLQAHDLDADTPVVRLRPDEVDDPDVLAEIEDTVLVIGRWHYTGSGHSVGEAIYAASIADEIAETKFIAKLAGTDDRWAA